MKPNTKTVTLYTGETKNVLAGSIVCDPNKAKRILADRGLIAADVSRELGFASNTLSGQLNAGVISGPMAAGLARVYDISKEAYEYVPESEEKVNTGEGEKHDNFAISETDMYKVMKAAFVDAIAEAFSENAGKIKAAIASAVAYAVRTEINRKWE